MGHSIVIKLLMSTLIAPLVVKVGDIKGVLITIAWAMAMVIVSLVSKLKDVLVKLGKLIDR
jgi:hypothetical protein